MADQTIRLKVKHDEASLLAHLLHDLAKGRVEALQYGEEYADVQLNSEGKALAKSLLKRLDKACDKVLYDPDSIEYFELFEEVK